MGIPFGRGAGKRSKYGVRTDEIGKQKRTVDGRLFASEAEANKYCELKLLQTAGVISNLECQKRFRLTVNGVFVTTYIADFVFSQDGVMVVMDRKGFQTDVYKIKKQLMLACLGITITEC